MISAGLEGRIPYMTYPEPWRGPSKQPPEFLRPAPKPITPSSTRYNGVSSAAPNGTRLAPSQRPMPKYTSPPSIQVPVNLTQHKDDVPDDLPYSAYRAYAAPHFPHFAPFTMYQPYPHMMRPTFLTTPLPSLDSYAPSTPTAITAAPTFLSPPATFSPPSSSSSSIKPGQSILRGKRTPPTIHNHIQSNNCQVAFKVPSGKEGSLKHRILTRPEDVSSGRPLDLQKSMGMSAEVARRRLSAATMSPPRSPKPKPSLPPPPAPPLNNNNTVPGNFNFAKGSLIQLANGDLRTIEDMRTEDFVASADYDPELRLEECTVVKIEDNRAGAVTITLSYNQRRTKVEVEAALEHPFFVFGQGWSSCSPDKSLLCYSLKVHRLQVGDILVALIPREHFVRPTPVPPTNNNHNAATSSTVRTPPTIMTTSTSTAMTPLPTSRNDQILHHHHHHLHQQQQQHLVVPQVQPINLHTNHQHQQHHHHHHHQRPMSPESLAARKRRWSAPEQICDEDEQQQQARMMKRQRVD